MSDTYSAQQFLAPTSRHAPPKTRIQAKVNPRCDFSTDILEIDAKRKPHRGRHRFFGWPDRCTLVVKKKSFSNEIMLNRDQEARSRLTRPFHATFTGYVHGEDRTAVGRLESVLYRQFVDYCLPGSHCHQNKRRVRSKISTSHSTKMTMRLT